MGLSTFGVVSAGSLTDTWDPAAGSTSIAQGELGAISVAHRGAGQFSIVKVVQMHATTRCSVSDVLMNSTATGSQGSEVATVAITAQGGQYFKGIAAASIASGRRGYCVIGGIATALMTQIATAGDYLAISGSTAAGLTNERGSGFGTVTWPLTSSFGLLARANNVASCISVGSFIQIHILGLWG